MSDFMGLFIAFQFFFNFSQFVVGSRGQNQPQDALEHLLDPYDAFGLWQKSKTAPKGNNRGSYFIRFHRLFITVQSFSSFPMFFVGSRGQNKPQGVLEHLLDPYDAFGL